MPHDPDFRLWSAQDAASFLPLKADDEVYRLEGVRFAVRAGRRYGVRVTVVTERGVRGHAVANEGGLPEVEEA